MGPAGQDGISGRNGTDGQDGNYYTLTNGTVVSTTIVNGVTTYMITITENNNHVTTYRSTNGVALGIKISEAWYDNKCRPTHMIYYDYTGAKFQEVTYAYQN
jgi:hypothetical protein